MDMRDGDGTGRTGLNGGFPTTRRNISARGKSAKIPGAKRRKADVLANQDVIRAVQKPALPPDAWGAIDYIREFGMQVYVEELHRQNMAEIRARILAATDMSPETLSNMPGARHGAIEQMIRDEIVKRLEANSMINKNPANDNGSYLKTMMLANQSCGFFAASTASGAKSFQEHFAQRHHQDPAYVFFRAKAEKK